MMNSGLASANRLISTAASATSAKTGHWRQDHAPEPMAAGFGRSQLGPAGPAARSGREQDRRRYGAAPARRAQPQSHRYRFPAGRRVQRSAPARTRTQARRLVEQEHAGQAERVDLGEAAADQPCAEPGARRRAREQLGREQAVRQRQAGRQGRGG